MDFSAPIPGQSLTDEPKNYPWERPPEIVDPESALQVHLARLSDPEMLEEVLDMVEIGELDIKTVTQGILRSAVANGIHTIDVGLIVAPVVHEFIKQAAIAVGIDFDEGFEDTSAKEKKREARAAALAAKKLKALGVKPKEVAKEIDSDLDDEGMEEGTEVTAEEMKPTRKGLMAPETYE